jgi:hypothetical protein
MDKLGYIVRTTKKNRDKQNRRNYDYNANTITMDGVYQSNIDYVI